MKNRFTYSFLSKIRLLALLTGFCLLSSYAGQAQMAVQKYGQLRVMGNKIVDQNNSPVVLRGMSLFWSQWMPKYYDYYTLKWLRDDWCINVIRVAMAVDQGGYATNPNDEMDKVNAMVETATELGIYVIIDFHTHNAPTYIEQAKTFFNEVSLKYKDSPNVIYEIWNEPEAHSWNDVIKPYCETIISVIRKNDTDNIIICGTRSWSQRVDEAALNPIKSSTNIAYTLHYYAGTHGSWLRNYATTALSKGIALFVTEYGVCEANGNGTINVDESNKWWTFLENNKISYCNWAVSDKSEAAAALKPGTSSSGNWTASMLTTSGTMVRNQLLAKCDKTNATPTGTTTGENADAMKLYPNPFTDNFEIELTEQSEYLIYNSSGNVSEQGAGTGKITLGNTLAPGLYILKIKSGDSERSYKITKY
jgi:endoglucanase